MVLKLIVEDGGGNLFKVFFILLSSIYEGRRIRTPVSISYWVLNPARLTAPAFPHGILLNDYFSIKRLGLSFS